MIDVITVRGTGEPLNGAGNMLSHVVRDLDPGRCRLLGDCPYPGTVGPVGAGPDGASIERSVAIGVTALAAMIRATPNRVGVLGYSLGALVVCAFLEAQARGEYADCELAWTACLANPARQEGNSIDRTAHGYGITGEHGSFPAGHVHVEAANPRDVITSCAAGSPLRAVADGMHAFALPELGGWSQNLVTRLRRGRFQPITLNWWRDPVRTWQLYSEAATQVLGYLDGSQHIRAYLDQGYCMRLAAAINGL